MTRSYRATRWPNDRHLSGWYHCLPKPDSLPSLYTTESVDVVIVGAGFAGLAAAQRLQQNDASLSIAILEAQGLAWGACGRNSGFMIDLPHELNSSNYSSEQNADLQQIAENRLSIDFTLETAKQWGLSECLDEVGKYHGATSGAGLKALNAYTEHLAALGEPFSILSKQSLAEALGTEYYDGGIHTPNAVLIQPAHYILGLGHGLHSLPNVTVYEHSPALEITASQNGVTVRTEHGALSAATVILANNGHIESFGIAPSRLLHLFTYASMTQQLSPEQFNTLGTEPSWGLIPAAPMGTTLRKLRDRRILIRNQWTYNPNLESSARQLKRYEAQHDDCFKRRFPHFSEVAMEYRWSGPIALTLNSVPIFGEIERNVLAATGCLGLGTTKSTLMGLLIADKITGKDNPLIDHYDAHPEPSRLPPSVLSRIGIPSYLKWSHWRAGNDL